MTSITHFTFKITLLASCLTLGACATPRAGNSPAKEESIPGVVSASEAPAPESSDIEKAILEANAEIEKLETHSADPNTPPPVRARIPLEINENVKKWIHYFTVQDRERFHRFLKRGKIYQPIVQEILRKNGVPTELYYLAMIESGYVTHARSHASAVGIWQFIRGTGLRYGLKQNSDLDERRDIIRATEAAAQYLHNLHNAFQSWYLALAGYNAGEGRILGALMRGGSRDFWELVEKKALPPETRDYVPKFLAATLIGKNPERYGFKDLESEPFPQVKALEVPGGVSLAAVAQKTGVSQSTLKTLNPHLLKGRAPRQFRQYSIWIPETHTARVDALERSLASLIPAADSTPPTRALPHSDSRRKVGRKPASAQKTQTVVHRVRKGEGLITIATRYQVPVKKIKKLNSLRSNRIYIGQRLIIARN